MERGLCWTALAIAGLLTLVFLLDWIMEMPFGRPSWGLDMLAVLAGSLIIYLCIDTLRELR